MPTPIILEPISTGDIIDRSVRIYRQNVRALLATAAVPFLFGAASWLCFKLGLAGITPGAESSLSGATAGMLLVVGFSSYVLYLYVMVLVVAGLARAIGDYLLLGQPLTVGSVLRSLKGRLLDLTVASLLLVGFALLIGMVFFVLILAAVMVVGLMAGVMSFLKLPDWVTGLFFLVLFVGAIGLIVLVILPVMLARVVFIPHAIMIEGASAGAAAGRSFTLGGGGIWKSVAAILLFTQCATFSLLVAVMIPILVVMWMGGLLTLQAEAFESIYGGVAQFSSFLLIPAWSIAYTLLYFDSRVRKEGYDVDLLARKLHVPKPVRPAAPAGVWAPQFAPQPTAEGGTGRCPRCGNFNLTNRQRCTLCGEYLSAV